VTGVSRGSSHRISGFAICRTLGIDPSSAPHPAAELRVNAISNGSILTMIDGRRIWIGCFPFPLPFKPIEDGSRKRQQARGDMCCSAAARASTFWRRGRQSASWLDDCRWARAFASSPSRRDAALPLRALGLDRLARPSEGGLSWLWYAARQRFVCNIVRRWEHHPTTTVDRGEHGRLSRRNGGEFWQRWRRREVPRPSCGRFPNFPRCSILAWRVHDF
jgi:hypothetical protein